MKAPDLSFAAAIDDCLKSEAWRSDDERQFLGRLRQDAMIGPSPHNKRLVERLIKAWHDSKFMMKSPGLERGYLEHVKKVRDAVKVLREEVFDLDPNPDPELQALKQSLDCIDEIYRLEKGEPSEIVSVVDITSGLEISLGNRDATSR